LLDEVPTLGEHLVTLINTELRDAIICVTWRHGVVTQHRGQRSIALGVRDIFINSRDSGLKSAFP